MLQDCLDVRYISVNFVRMVSLVFEKDVKIAQKYIIKVRKSLGRRITMVWL